MSFVSFQLNSTFNFCAQCGHDFVKKGRGIAVLKKGQLLLVHNKCINAWITKNAGTYKQVGQSSKDYKKQEISDDFTGVSKLLVAVMLLAVFYLLTQGLLPNSNRR